VCVYIYTYIHIYIYIYIYIRDHFHTYMFRAKRRLTLTHVVQTKDTHVQAHNSLYESAHASACTRMLRAPKQSLVLKPAEIPTCAGDRVHTNECVLQCLVFKLTEPANQSLSLRNRSCTQTFMCSFIVSPQAYRVCEPKPTCAKDTCMYTRSHAYTRTYMNAYAG
jgi:hypothetical protein